MRHFAMSTMVLALIGAGPALAESQSSNSSSNCSNDRCTRVESLIIDDGRGSRRYFRREAWDGRRGRWRESQHYEDRDRWERRYRGDRRGRDDDHDD